jgi:hypothetical protein
MEPERTSIQIYRGTLKKIRQFGRFGESYDGVLNRILNEHRCHDEMTLINAKMKKGNARDQNATNTETPASLSSTPEEVDE